MEIEVDIEGARARMNIRFADGSIRDAILAELSPEDRRKNIIVVGAGLRDSILLTSGHRRFMALAESICAASARLPHTEIHGPEILICEPVPRRSIEQSFNDMADAVEMATLQLHNFSKEVALLELEDDFRNKGEPFYMTVPKGKRRRKRRGNRK